MTGWIQWIKSHPWYTLAGALGILCLYAVFQEIIPQIIELAEMQKTIRQNNLRVAQVEEWDWTIQRMQKKKEKLHQQIEALVYSQQKKNQFSSIYKFLSETALKYDVQLINMKPGESESGNRYIRLPIALRMNAGYHGLARYINALEISEPIIQIDSWILEARDMTSPDLNATVVIWVYFLT